MSVWHQTPPKAPLLPTGPGTVLEIGSTVPFRGKPKIYVSFGSGFLPFF